MNTSSCSSRDFLVPVACLRPEDRSKQEPSYHLERVNRRHNKFLSSATDTGLPFGLPWQLVGFHLPPKSNKWTDRCVLLHPTSVRQHGGHGHLAAASPELHSSCQCGSIPHLMHPTHPQAYLLPVPHVPPHAQIACCNPLSLAQSRQQCTTPE